MELTRSPKVLKERCCSSVALGDFYGKGRLESWV